jgi:hypothetical protein
MREVQIGGSQSEVRPQAKTRDPIQKITRQKCAQCVVQVVEILPSKYEDLSSTPSNSKNRMKQGEKKNRNFH